MKPEGPSKHFILAFLLALVGYFLFYQAIERRRACKGPWQVTFTHSATGVPAIVVDQPSLAITNVQISFPGESFLATNSTDASAFGHARPESPVANYQSPIATLLFAQPQSVPYEVPFGKCVFMDTTFLPGTITFELFGHEIELLPRTLVVDQHEHVWRSDSTFTLQPTQSAPNRAQP